LPAFPTSIQEFAPHARPAERKYRHPLEYPGEQSGPTGRIGYDFGTQTKAQIRADWADKVDAAMLSILLGASGMRRGGRRLVPRDPRAGRHSLAGRARRVRQS